jgi:hypothetical protein
MMAIIGRHMKRLNFITKNIVALDGIQPQFYLYCIQNLGEETTWKAATWKTQKEMGWLAQDRG